MSLVISVLANYAIGLRDNALFAASMLALLPTSFVVAALTMRLFPPDVAISGDVRHILHPGELHDPELPPDPIVLGAPSDIPITEAMPARADGEFSWLPRAPQTFEGWGICLVAIAILAGNLYLVAERTVYSLVPEFHTTKRGPAAFPAMVHIGAGALQLTNGSNQAWHCVLSLGRRESYYASVNVDSGEARDIGYERFQEKDVESRADDPAGLRTAAREKVTADCRDSDGRTHFWIFN